MGGGVASVARAWLADLISSAINQHQAGPESTPRKQADGELLLSPPALDALKPPAPEVPADAHRYELTIRPSDLDIFNHVNAATYLELCDNARLSATADGVGAWDAPLDGAAIHYHQETLVHDRVTLHTREVAPRRLTCVLAVGGEVRCTAMLSLR